MLKLKQIRLSKGLSQREVGEILGVSQAAASRYELGKRKLDQDQIIALSLALDITPGELLGFEEAYKNYTNYLMELTEEKEKH